MPFGDYSDYSKHSYGMFFSDNKNVDEMPKKKSLTQALGDNSAWVKAAEAASSACGARF